MEEIDEPHCLPIEAVPEGVEWSLRTRPGHTYRCVMSWESKAGIEDIAAEGYTPRAAMMAAIAKISK